MLIETRPVVINVDRELLEHRTHLPETITCHCGYVRPVQPAPTLGE